MDSVLLQVAKIFMIAILLSEIGCTKQPLTPVQIEEAQFKKDKFDSIVGIYGIMFIAGVVQNNFIATGTVIRDKNNNLVIVTAGAERYKKASNIYALRRVPKKIFNKLGNRTEFDEQKIPLENIKNDLDSGLVILRPKVNCENLFSKVIEIANEKLYTGDQLWFFHYKMKPEITNMATPIELKSTSSGTAPKKNPIFMIEARIGLGDIGAPLLNTSGELVGVVLGHDTEIAHWVYAINTFGLL